MVLNSCQVNYVIDIVSLDPCCVLQHRNRVLTKAKVRPSRQVTAGHLKQRIWRSNMSFSVSRLFPVFISKLFTALELTGH